MLDNSTLVAQFVPEKDDGDTFIYTEMLDRGEKKGNNGQRLLKTFHHRSREEFWDQWPTIQKLCDMSKVRACTRLAPRSYAKVAGVFLRLVTETYITKNFAGMKTLYNRAMGTVTPEQKLWLLDVDKIDNMTNKLVDRLKEEGHLVARIPSKKAEHLIIKPFDARGEWTRGGSWAVWGEVSLHKDNPTNLYIPDGAD